MADFVIVGGGSAGCVLAARLSENPDRAVLLLEAGPAPNVPEVMIPAAFSRLFQGARDWAYWTEPQPELEGRSLFWPRGRMLGGSSGMTAMMWVRGVPVDYEWGVPGWTYSEARRIFRSIEDTERSGGDEVGIGGPVKVVDQRAPNPRHAPVRGGGTSSRDPPEPRRQRG